MSETSGLARGLTNYGDPDFSLYLRRSFAKSMGYRRDAGAAGRRHRRHRRAASTTATATSPSCSRRSSAACWRPAALPLEFPTISLGEVFLSPTSLMFRNLMAMDTEEMIRAQPMDAVVLMAAATRPCRRS